MAFQIESGTGDGTKVDVNPDNTFAIKPTTTVANIGLIGTASIVDPGTVTGSVLARVDDTTDDYRKRVGVDSPIFEEVFYGSALNTSLWSSNLTTMTVAVSNNKLQLNSGNSTATSAVARVTSYAPVFYYATFPLYLEFDYLYSADTAAKPNNVTEIGAFIASGITAPTDGVFLRYTATGNVVGVINYNGAETSSDPFTAPAANVSHRLLIIVTHNKVEFWIDGVLQTTVLTPAGQGSPTSSTNLPISIRNYNPAAAGPSTAVQVWVYNVSISSGDNSNLLDFENYLTLMGRGGYQGQTGATIGQLTNWTNSAEPVAAVLSNTAAGYTTPDGQWSFAAIAGAATDYCLFGYQVPAAAANAMNRSLQISGARISAINTVVAVATTPTVLQWGMAVGSTAVSLATPEAATTRAPKRIPLGMQGFVVGAAAGAVANDIVVTFQNPLIVEPGSFLQTILRVPVGTATATEVFRGTVYYDKKWI